MKTKAISPVLLAIAILASCDKKPVDKFASKHYFDLSKYAQTEAQRLNSKHLLAIKKVSEGEKEESKTITNIDWQKELTVIAEADINRPAWTEKYQQDSMVFDNTSLITYTAQDPNLMVKKIVLTKAIPSGECLSITIEKGNENLLYSSWQKIYYTPGSQLNIYGHLSVKWLLENDYATDLVVVEPTD